MKKQLIYRFAFIAFIFIFILIISCTCSGSTITPISQNIISSKEANLEPSITYTVPIERQIISTDTIITPTNTPENKVNPGTYLVGTDIQPGYYKGIAGDNILDSCYWARLKDVTGSLDSIIANDNSYGQFYIHVLETDFALETKCVLDYLPSLPSPIGEFPTHIEIGTYLVGIDIQFGTYRGQAGTEILESCYWARLKDVTGGLGSIIANDNATGQFYVKVEQTDFALQTKCKLDRVGD
jgi:hypothetical protein